MSAMDEARTAVEFLTSIEQQEPLPETVAQAQAYALLAIAEELRTANLIAAYRQNLIWGDAKDVTIAIRDRLDLAQ